MMNLQEQVFGLYQTPAVDYMMNSQEQVFGHRRAVHMLTSQKCCQKLSIAASIDAHSQSCEQ